MVGIERVLFDPYRTRVGERLITRARSQPRGTLHDRRKAFGQGVVARCAVEKEHDADRHAQPRIVSGPPHDGFDRTETLVHALSLAPSRLGRTRDLLTCAYGPAGSLSSRWRVAGRGASRFGPRRYELSRP